jgi:hypothetical protein
MRLRFPAGFVVAMLWCSVSAGQTPPIASAADIAAFQGTWVLDLVRSGLTEAAAERRVITTDATSMRVDVYRPRDVRAFTLVYNLDGSPTTNPFGDGSAVSKIRREGSGFLTETVYTVKDQPVTVREILPPLGQPTPPGAEMAIEVMVRVEHGYQGAPSSLESPPNASKATKVFKKQP